MAVLSPNQLRMHYFFRCWGLNLGLHMCVLSLSYNTAHHTIFFKAKGNKFKRFAEFFFLPQDHQGFCFPNNLSIVSGVS